MNPIIIGIGHKARQGKNAVADAMAAHAPREVKVYSWANAIKVFCRVALGMREKDAPLLQLVGTDYFRLGRLERLEAIEVIRSLGRHRAADVLASLADVLEHDPQIWIRVLLDQIAEDGPRFAVVPDTRFLNEIGVCRYAIKVSRGTRQAGGFVPFVSGDRDPRHGSETALDRFDGWHFEIVNDRTLEDLEAEAVAIFERIRRER